MRIPLSSVSCLRATVIPIMSATEYQPSCLWNRQQSLGDPRVLGIPVSGDREMCSLSSADRNIIRKIHACLEYSRLRAGNDKQSGHSLPFQSQILPCTGSEFSEF